MKQISLFLFPALLAGALFFACKNDATYSKTTANAGPAPDTVRIEPVPAEGAVPFSIVEGALYWSAKKAIGKAHDGTITLAGGELMVNRGRLVGGQAAFDMGSIEVTNMNDPGEKATLESHLKDKDFFEVRKYPQAQFVIDEILPSNLPAFNWVIRGNLTIKDQTHPVNVPVQLTIDGDELRAESASFILDRTKWGLKFRSGLLGTARDKIIEDVVPVSLKVVARRKW